MEWWKNDDKVAVKWHRSSIIGTTVLPGLRWLLIPGCRISENLSVRTYALVVGHTMRHTLEVAQWLIYSTPMFIAALFIIGKSQGKKKSRCPLTGEQCYSHMMENYSAIKHGLLIIQQHERNSKSLCQVEKSKFKQGTYQKIPFI